MIKCRWNMCKNEAIVFYRKSDFDPAAGYCNDCNLKKPMKSAGAITREQFIESIGAACKEDIKHMIFKHAAYLSHDQIREIMNEMLDSLIVKITLGE